MDRFKSKNQTYLVLLLLAIALAGYIAPWVLAPSGSMSLGAYDLAEWTSLHPSQRHASPPLLAPLLLRLQLVIICLMLGAAAARQPWRILSAVCIILLAVGQLPPPEFAQDLGNLNYRQQFGMAIFSLIAGLALLQLRYPRVAFAALIFAPLLGVASAIIGYSQAYNIFGSMYAGAAIGLGFWILVASYSSCLALVLVDRLRRARPQS